MKFDNRVTRMLGVEIPIVQAPAGCSPTALGGSGSRAAASCWPPKPPRLRDLREPVRKKCSGSPATT